MTFGQSEQEEAVVPEEILRRLIEESLSEAELSVQQLLTIAQSAGAASEYGEALDPDRVREEALVGVECVRGIKNYLTGALRRAGGTDEDVRRAKNNATARLAARRQEAAGSI